MLACLDVLPLTHNLRTASSHLTSELRIRVGIRVMPADNAGTRSPSGAMLRDMLDAVHALACPKHSGVCMLRHT